MSDLCARNAYELLNFLNGISILSNQVRPL
jgi:hypothetical protein